MKVSLLLPDGVLDFTECVSVDMPAVPRVGDRIGLDSLDYWLVATSVEWHFYSSHPVAVSDGATVRCEILEVSE